MTVRSLFSSMIWPAGSPVTRFRIAMRGDSLAPRSPSGRRGSSGSTRLESRTASLETGSPSGPIGSLISTVLNLASSFALDRRGALAGDRAGSVPVRDADRVGLHGDLQRQLEQRRVDQLERRSSLVSKSSRTPSRSPSSALTAAWMIVGQLLLVRLGARSSGRSRRRRPGAARRRGAGGAAGRAGCRPARPSRATPGNSRGRRARRPPGRRREARSWA